jgi:hypothetical protein
VKSEGLQRRPGGLKLVRRKREMSKERSRDMGNNFLQILLGDLAFSTYCGVFGGESIPGDSAANKFI